MSVEDNSKYVRTTFDVGSGRHSNCLYWLDEFDASVDQLRSARENDVQNLFDSMTALVKNAFDDLEESEDGFDYVAERATDRLHRIVSQPEISDVFTFGYISIVVRELFMQLAKRGLTTYYVLDNALRADRFEYVCKVFEQAGIKVTTPQLNGTDWTTLSNLIKAHNKGRMHVAYIEPDSVVNYIKPAVLLAKELNCIATFRNEAPNDPIFNVITNPNAPWQLISD